MARAGLTAGGWKCLFANDFDAKKVAAYQANWGTNEIREGDVGRLTPEELPGHPDLVWASFPCQDLSLAGGGAGLMGDRSGTFWPFWKLMLKLKEGGRLPTTIVLENVCGTLTSHGGKDFEAICSALVGGGFSIGALVMDAALFVPHSRPRLFVVGVRGDLAHMSSRATAEPNPLWHTRALIAAQARLPKGVQKRWVWWDLPAPPSRADTFSAIVEENPNDVGWHDAAETQKLLAMMSPVHRKKIDAAKQAGRRVVGTLYRRTRQEDDGRIQRAEVRFDDVAGCLRTPAGGSSRQILIFVEGQKVRTRLISARETARLMGLSDSYLLPDRYNEAYHLTGDGVVVPVVDYLSRQILLPSIAPGSERLVA